MTSIVSSARRLSWGMADQAMSSLSNFALAVAVARLVSAEEFGAFAVAFTTYLIALNVGRHLAAQPLAIRYPDVSLEVWRRATSASQGLILVLAIVMAAILLILAAIIRGSVGSSFMALALFLPGLLMQDGWRFAFFARSRGDLAFFNDLTWAGILLLELAVLSQVGVAGSLQILVAWGLAGTCATLLGIVQGRTVPDPRLAYGWWREHRDIGPRYLASELAAMATVQLVVYIVGAVAGLVAAGSLRAAQVLIGPINIMTMGVYLVVIPQAARIHRTDRRAFLRLCYMTSAFLVSATLAELAVILVFPDLIGPTLLGDSWPGAATVIVPIAVAAAVRSATFGARMGLAATAAARVLLRWTVVEAIVTVAAGVVGVMVGGAPGAAWGMAVAGVVVFVPWWRELRAHRTPITTATEAAPTATDPASVERRALDSRPSIRPQVD